jgi:hypothetical protein
MNRLSTTSVCWKKFVLGLPALALAATLPAVASSKIINTFGAASEAAGWTFNNGGEFPGARGSFAIASGADGANQYAQLSYDFTPPSPLPANFNPHYVQTIRVLDTAEAAGATRLRLRAWGGQSGARFYLRWLDSTGQWFQSYSIFANSSEDAQFKTLLLDLRSKSFSWAGAADGVVHFPITKIAIVGDATGLRNSGWLRFDDIELLSEEEASAVEQGSQIVLNRFSAAGEDSQWSFYNGGEFPGARGGISLGSEPATGIPYAQLRYDFTVPSPLPANFNPHYVQASRKLTAAEAAGLNTRIRFKAQKSRPDLNLNLRWVDSAGQTFQQHALGSETLEQTNEGLHELTVDLRASDSHWGGPNDGVTRFPLKSIAFVCDATGFRDTGWARFGDIVFMSEASAPVTTFSASADMDGWRFYNGGEFPGARGSIVQANASANACAQLNYDFTVPSNWTGRFDPHYVEAFRGMPARASGVKLKFTVSRPDVAVRLRYLDSAGQTFQETLSSGFAIDNIPVNTWVERSVSFVPIGLHWGGPNDGVVHFPIKRLSLVLDAPNHRDTGYLKFDDVEIATEEIASVELGTGTLVAPRWGAGTLGERAGVSVHATNDPRGMDAVRAAGFGWVRMDAHWNTIEQVPGVYNFSTFDALVNAAEQRGIWTVAILDYGNVLHTGGAMNPPKSTAELNAYENYCAAIAAHYAGRKVAFEVWNEPDVPGFWGGVPNAYEFSNALSKGIAGVRRGNPGAQVFSGGLSSVHATTYQFLDTQLASGAMTGATGLGVHLYGSGYPELQWGNVIRLKAKAAASTGGNLWCSEWGFSSTDLSPNGHGQDTEGRGAQARMAVRQLFLGWWADLPVVMLYDLLDDGSNPAEPEHNYGLLARDYSEKPAMVAVKKFLAVSKNRTLAGLYRPANLPAGLHMARLDGAGDFVHMVWADEATPDSVLVVGDTRAVAVDMYGNRLSFVRAGGKLTLVIRPGMGPVYVTLPR